MDVGQDRLARVGLTDAQADRVADGHEAAVERAGLDEVERRRGDLGRVGEDEGVRAVGGHVVLMAGIGRQLVAGRRLGLADLVRARLGGVDLDLAGRAVAVIGAVVDDDGAVPVPPGIGFG